MNIPTPDAASELTNPPDMIVVLVRLEHRRGEYAAFHHPTKGWFINGLNHKDRGCSVKQWRLAPEHES